MCSDTERLAMHIVLHIRWFLMPYVIPRLLQFKDCEFIFSTAAVM